MKSVEEQIADKCIHFTGLGNKVCDAGVEYDKVKTKSTSPYKVPCLRNCQMSGGFYGCDKQHFPTEEEVKAEIEEIGKIAGISITAYDVISKHIESTGEEQGKIECPNCKGELSYIRASVNKHIWANCKCGISIRE